MQVTRYRLRMSRFVRIVRAGVFGALAGGFVPMVVSDANDLPWRALSLAGFLSALYGLYVVLGPAVEVRPEGLRIRRAWARRRDIAWYRIYQLEVVPGSWTLDVELNSGEYVDLPCVEHFELLYEQIQDLRQRLDA